MTAPRNLILLKSGRARIVCQYCDRRSGPRSGCGIDLLPRGWWVAPFPDNFVHRFDGSTGDLYTCPECAENRIGRKPCLTRGLDPKPGDSENGATK